jgi:hypothetical protein
MKLDSTFEMEWIKLYGGNVWYAKPLALCITPDSGFVVSGYKILNNTEMNGWIFKTDKHGNVEWDKQMGGAFDDNIFSICLSEDSTILVALADSYNDYPYVGYPYYRTKIIRLNYQTGQIIWLKTYYHDWKLVGKSIIEDNFGNIYVACDMYEVDTVNNYATGYVGGLLKTDSSGDSIWLRTYTHLPFNQINFEHFIYDIIQTSDNGFLITGSYRTFYPYSEALKTWVIKLDSLGCDTPGCHTAGIPKNVVFVNELKIFPNPSKDHISIELPPSLQDGMLEIRNSEGKLIEINVIHSGKTMKEVSISNYSEGIYIIVLRRAGKFIGVGKFVKK